MPTPAVHYARAEELLAQAAGVRRTIDEARAADPRPVDDLRLAAWRDRRTARVAALSEAERLTTAAQAHATLATVRPTAGDEPRLLTADESDRLLEVFQSLTAWAACDTAEPARGSGHYRQGHAAGTDEAKVTVRALLDHARGVLAR